ncbi:Membrane primary amine oxidase [Trichoderma lentiforme]|uniref:Amine oxidase n=1 Tax=Trichoderma lentiforme TaxID=1567552 RepID=A0A9P4XBK5_9HYPO|nr:Membrane primary amine oxidase [Trichoderma lentiforme]
MKMFASRTFGLIISVYLAAVISSYSYYAWSTSWSRVKAHHQQSSPYPVCKSRQPSVSAPHQNIWGGLADKEVAGIIDLLHQHSTGLNLTTEDRAGSIHPELLVPNKSDVLLFINKNTTKPPPRYARATLMFGATPNPFLQDYVIGPLPITNNTQVQPLQFLYNNAGKGKVAVDFADRSEVLQLAKDVGLSVVDITKLLWDGLGLQEALAHYAGNDPVQSGTTYFDSKPGVGPSVVTLIDGGFERQTMGQMAIKLIGALGYDCPTYSTYLNVIYNQGEIFHSRPNAICEFGHFCISEHADKSRLYYQEHRFYSKVFSTIANYDYMFSYTFFLDGSIEVSVRASGYILGGFSANNEEYGWNIHDNLSGSIRDHVLTYKADIDIFGEKNSLQKVEFVPVTTEYPWSNGAKRNTMKIQKSFIQNENEAKINWAPNGAATYAIVNKEARNTLGEYPGYKFSPASNAVFLTVLNSSNAMNAVNFADHHFYVTKQKDTEAQATHPYNILDPIEPIIDFAKFFDGESLDQEDLVLWFNLGMHDAPHTGDLPNTVFTTAHSALIIEPLNYLDLDASRATSQQVRLNYKDEKV